MSCNWPQVKLGELVEITSSKRVKMADYVEKGVPFFRSKEIIERYKGNTITTELYITEEHYQAIKDKFGAPEEGHILLTSVGTLGIPYQVQANDKFYFKDGNLTWFKEFGNAIDAEYLFYWLTSPIAKRKFDEITIGSTQKALTIVALKGIEIDLPPKHVQKQVVQIVKSLDKKLANNRGVNQTLEQMAQAIFKSWFVDFDPVKAKMNGEQPEGMDAATASLFPEKLVESELGLIPEGWEIQNTQDLFEVKDGTHDSPKKAEEGHYLVTSKHITKGKIDTSSAYLISDADFHKVNQRSKVDTFDILLTMIGTVGEVVVVYDNPVEFAIKNVGLFKTSQRPELVWLFYWHLQSFKMKHYLEVRMAGTTQQYLTLKTLRTIPVVLPSNELLAKFNEVMSPLMEKISDNHKQNQTLSNLRDTLLPKLLSGEIELGTSEELVEAI
ncbi:TPA: restriction endonuclease subunit S [Vibrio parahaemolyticus]